MSSIVGLKGEVFAHEGRVALAINAKGIKGAVEFRVGHLHPATVNFPAWADMMVGHIACRINPAICKPPYFRLADCVSAVAANHKLFRHPPDMMALPLTGQTYLFWLESIGGRSVVLIDTKARVEQWHSRT